MPEISVAFQTDKPLAAYGPLAQTAEKAGFDGVSVYNDMLYQPAWLPLLEIARHTNRVKIGPAAVNPFTSHPINIAGNLALLDEASGGRAFCGRIFCGFARGAWLDFVGLDPPNPVAALREALVCVRHLLRRDKDPLIGEHFPLQGGDALRWPTIRPDIPFMLGSWGPRTIAACAPLVSEIKLGGTANSDVVRHYKSFLSEQDAAVAVAIGSVTVVDADGRAARDLARREVALYLPIVAGLDPTVTVEPERLQGLREAMQRYDSDTAVTYISDDLLRKFAFAGTPAEVAAQALELFNAGADRVEFGTPHGVTPQQGLKLLGERVLPQIRSAV